MVPSPRLLRQAEALQFVDGIAQVRLRRTVRLFYCRVVRRFDRQTRLPAYDFDLCISSRASYASAVVDKRLTQYLREQTSAGTMRTISATRHPVPCRIDSRASSSRLTAPGSPGRTRHIGLRQPFRILRCNSSYKWECGLSCAGRFRFGLITSLPPRRGCRMHPSTCCFALKSFSKSAA